MKQSDEVLQEQANALSKETSELAETVSATPAQEKNQQLEPVGGSVLRYLLLAFGISWVLFVAAGIFKLNGMTQMFTPLSALGMFGPLLAVLILCRGLKRKVSGVKWQPVFRGKIGWWIAAWLGLPALCVLGTGLYYALFPQNFDPTGQVYLTAQMGPELAAKAMAGTAIEVYFLISLVSALVGAFINQLFALGEETGWRGYLYPRLKARFGATGGRVLGGIIWGCWHWPLMILTGYEYGWGISNAPWYLILAGMGAFCVVCVALGILLDFLYQKTGSILAPALAHGAFNAVANIGLMLFAGDYATQSILGPTAIGMVGGLPLFVSAVVVLLFDRSNTKKSMAE